MEKDASKRLGNRFCPSGDIQDQLFFKPIQWDRLEARMLESPFKPNLVRPILNLTVENTYFAFYTATSVGHKVFRQNFYGRES